MPTLIESIIDYEPDQLEMLAEQWGIDQELDPAKSAARQIAARLLDRALFIEVLQALPDKAYQALLRLARSGGKSAVGPIPARFRRIARDGRCPARESAPRPQPGFPSPRSCITAASSPAPSCARAASRTSSSTCRRNSSSS